MVAPRQAPRLTAVRLRQVVSYYPETGDFRWVDQRGGRDAGTEAGTVGRTGYRAITIDKEYHLAHRLAWLYVHGRWPSAYIDHINGDKADNRLANLREASHAQNLRNSRLPKDNTSGFKGVVWDKRSSKWQAQIRADGRLKYLGQFQNIDDAAAAYRDAAQRLHGEFARVA